MEYNWKKRKVDFILPESRRPKIFTDSNSLVTKKENEVTINKINKEMRNNEVAINKITNELEETKEGNKITINKITKEIKQIAERQEDFISNFQKIQDNQEKILHICKVILMESKESNLESKISGLKLEEKCNYIS